MLVIESGVICCCLAQRVKAQLEKSGCRILGVVLNWVGSEFENGYYGRYGKYDGKYAGRDTVQIPVGQAAANTGTSGSVETNSRGQAVIGDTALEFVPGSGHAVIGLPDAVVASIHGINEGKALSQVVPGLELTGYYALSGTHALMTKTLDTNEEKTGAVEFPLYVPNLMEGLGTVQVLFYDNMLGQWRLITPDRIDAGAKILWMTVPGSGTLVIIYSNVSLE